MTSSARDILKIIIVLKALNQNFCLVLHLFVAFKNNKATQPFEDLSKVQSHDRRSDIALSKYSAFSWYISSIPTQEIAELLILYKTQHFRSFTKLK